MALENPSSLKISRAEYAVMDILWADAPLSALEIAGRLSGTTGWHSRTVKTLLSRLKAKGAVEVEDQGVRFIYRPSFPRADYIQAESKELLDRLFGGRVSPLVAHMARRDDLSSDDAEQIARLLKNLKNDQ